MKRKKNKITLEECGICSREMPGEMGKWLAERISSGQVVKVTSKARYDHSFTGYAMKSRDCIVMFFPGWQGNAQLQDIVNKF